MRETDIAIVGGGLAGTAAAVALARKGYSVCHFSPEGPRDKRTSALMGPSVDVLKDQGLIDEPATLAEPLRRIRIIDATHRLIRAPETLFDAQEAGHEAFGWNFPNADLLDAFKTRAEGLDGLETVASPLKSIERAENGYTLIARNGRKVEAKLVVAADGKRSMVRQWAGISVREKKHKQSALVSDLELERPLDQTSVEFHYENGPFTLVPAGGNKANLVWIDTADVLAKAKNASSEAFEALLEKKSQMLFGRIRCIEPPVIFPLSSLFVNGAAAEGVVLVGEAAHAFPPIGAQGLNLGLRDVADLIAALEATGHEIPDWPARTARTYGERRAKDLTGTGAMVDALFGTLLTDFLPTQAIRATGLWALRMVPGLRTRAFSIGMGSR